MKLKKTKKNRSFIEEKKVNEIELKDGENYQEFDIDESLTDMKNIINQTELKSIFDELLSDDNILMKTELSYNEIRQVTISSVYAERLDFDFIIKMIKTFLMARVSKNREGRNELVKISVNALLSQLLKENDSKLRRFGKDE